VAYFEMLYRIYPGR